MGAQSRKGRLARVLSWLKQQREEANPGIRCPNQGVHASCLLVFLQQQRREQCGALRCWAEPCCLGAAARSDLHRRLSFPQGTFSETS